TPVPEKEDLREIIKTRPTLILFLSISRLAEIVEILKSSYPPSTPVAVLYKVSWPDEVIVTGTIEDILERTKEQNFKKTALIIVGEVLAKKGGVSQLYNEGFSHAWRPML
ncbi:MAG TPA: SAM-dependent methyltransferase, partial [Nitrospiria bacterium]|nr:SAM-dependent methyltransferase [Nitrospiria bacterium]